MFLKKTKKTTIALRYSAESLRLLSWTFEVTSDPLWSFFTWLLVCVFAWFTSISGWITAVTVIGTDTIQNHCSEYNYVDDLCVKQTHTHVNTRTDPHRGTYKHVYLHMIQYLREMWVGTENHFVTIYPWIKLQSGSTCHSIETVRHYLPLGSGEKDLQQMDGLIQEGSGS